LKKEMRRLSKVMGANLDGQIKRDKVRLLQIIKEIDEKVEVVDLDDEEWKMRYILERDLEDIYTYEEKIWQKRYNEKWVLKGVANT
jgi:hypothetical protein